MARTTLEVMQDHLNRADHGDVEGDLATNFAEDCIILTSFGRFDGHDGIRAAAALLMEQVKGGKWRYLRLDVAGELAFLEWTGDGSSATVSDGADSFIVRDDKVRYMTAHYTVVPK